MKSKIIEEIQKGVPGYTTKADAERAYDVVVGAIGTVIARDKEARVPPLGNFKLKFREGRTVRNPRNNEMVNVAARDVITFRETKKKS